ncbi:MAG: 4-hydroxy-3-methylbut-2-en-1-yl diphosphate synthase [Bacteroidales bacterium]
MQNYFNYNRRISSPVHIGSLIMGGDAPIRIQSMTNTSTMDTEKSVEQAIRIIDAGGELVRLTAQGVREAQNLLHIRAGLRDRGYISTPLVADIHFNPKAADAAAKVVEKVRINPGNYVDSAKRFSHIEYSEEEYQQELARIREKFLPFLEICRKHKTAIRIGVNHGSLSDRIMSRYGDTPRGMVESCMEFLRICVEEKFHDVVISMKASNTLVMVQSVRLLVSQMDAEGISFPLHLGVTEAGDGEDGRIKSAVGIGALLADGLGDTIRVSLSEDPELEIPVARKLVDYYQTRENHPFIEAEYLSGYNWAMPEVRKTKQIHQIGGSAQPVVLSDRSHLVGDLRADYVFDSSKNIVCGQNGEEYPILSAEAYLLQGLPNEILNFVQLDYKSLTADLLQKLNQETKPLVLILFSEHLNPVGEIRAILHKLMIAKCDLPVVLKLSYKDTDPEEFQLKSSADAGAFLLSGLGNGIWLDAPTLSTETLISTSFAILQAARLRVSKTEYISCPSCGRTLFDLQKTIARIKEKTTHLKGLKIGIMGCIVNGPGEMADADYGYVGAGRGTVSLYKRKECIEKNIPEEEAVEKLIELIKENGDWKEK